MDIEWKPDTDINQHRPEAFTPEGEYKFADNESKEMRQVNSTL